MTNYKPHLAILLLISLFFLSNSLKELPKKYQKQTIDFNFKNKYDINKILYSPDQKFLFILENAKQQIQVYNGRRNTFNGTLKIIDQTFDNVSPQCMTFNKDSNLLFVGTQQGAVYGYTIQNGVISDNYVYRMPIVIPKQSQNIIRSLSISSDDKYIAIGAQTLVQIFTINKQQKKLQNFKKIIIGNQDIYSLSWSQSRLLIGGLSQNTGLFSIYDSTKQLGKDKNPISINTNKTVSVKFSSTGKYYIQGALQKDMSIYNSADNKLIQTVAKTNNTKQIYVSQNDQFIGVTSSTGVFAWNVKISEQNNLRNSLKDITLTLTQALNQTGVGLNLAFSQNGNSILVISNLQTAQRYGLCLDGNFFNTLTNDCSKCSLDCQTCFQQNLCQSCNVGTYFKNQSCVLCSETFQGCLQCSQNQCSKCDTNLNWKQLPIDGTCVCDDKFYNQNKTCKSCSIISHCQTCKSSQICLTCSGENFNPQAQDGKCLCLQKYILVQDACPACSSFIDGCLKCSSTQDCSSCDPQSNYDPTPDPVNHKCLCADKYYFNNQDKQCALCSTKIYQCQQCTQDGTQCNLCKVQDNRIINQNKTLCLCDKFYFENDQSKLCQKCDLFEKCQKCQNKDTCQVCNKANNWILNNDTKQCVCMDGFYQDKTNNLCVQCDVVGCSQCSQDAECDSCSQQKGFVLQPENNTCSCVPSRYLNPVNKVCDLCHDAMIGCQQCSQQNQCTKCDHDNNFNQTTDNKCACNYGFFINPQNNTQCVKCSKYNLGCVDCSNEKQCKKCNTKNHFYEDPNKQGSCLCVDTYYKNIDKKQCTLCSSSINNCLNCQITVAQSKLTCSKCQDGFDLSSDKSRCQQADGLGPLVIIAIIIGILAVAGAIVAIIKCCKKRNSPLEDDQYQALEER